MTWGQASCASAVGRDGLNLLHPREEGCGGFHLLLWWHQSPQLCLISHTMPIPSTFTSKMLSCPVAALSWSQNPSSSHPGLLGHYTPVTQGLAFLIWCWELWQGLVSREGIKRTGRYL